MTLGLRAQLLTGLALLAVVGMALAGVVTLLVAQDAMEEPLRDRARATARTAARLIESSIDAGAPLAAQGDRLRTVATSLRDAASADEIAVLDPAGRVLAASERAIEGRRYDEPPVALAAESGEPVAHADGDVLRLYHPVRAPGPGRALAVVRVQSAATASTTLARPWRLLALLTALNGLVVLAAAAFVLTRWVVRPIERLRASSRRAAGGDLSHTVAVEGAGEIAELERSFNEMTVALRDHIQRLQAAREQLVQSEKLASVGRLAAGVAHEVGNPLAAILGYAELLREGAADVDTRELGERIGRETRRIDAIIRELLDFSRPVAGAIEPVDLREVVDAAVSLLAPQPRMREVRVARDLPALPPVAGGAGRLTQVLVNLLLNAADAMDGAGTVRVAARDAGDAVELRVSDTGPGVPPDLRGRLFEPFFTTKEPGRGTGLGLAICRSIVESYGGTIALDEDAGTGATFVVTLPRFRGSGFRVEG